MLNLAIIYEPLVGLPVACAVAAGVIYAIVRQVNRRDDPQTAKRHSRRSMTYVKFVVTQLAEAHRNSPGLGNCGANPLYNTKCGFPSKTDVSRTTQIPTAGMRLGFNLIACRAWQENMQFSAGICINSTPRAAKSTEIGAICRVVKPRIERWPISISVAIVAPKIAAETKTPRPVKLTGRALRKRFLITQPIRVRPQFMVRWTSTVTIAATK